MIKVTKNQWSTENGVDL